MDIMVALAFDEKAALRLLNWLAKENEREIRTYDRRAARKGESSLPGLYQSGVRYEVEKEELWSDYINTLVQGHEDCDALSAARAGELMARGWRALRPRDPRDPVRYPGDGGVRTAMLTKPRSIRAEVMLTTDGRPGRPGLYHCIVRYWVGRREYRDDPSARLGMLTGDSAEEKAGIAGSSVGARSVVSRCVSGKVRREGWTRNRAVAACLNMQAAGRLGPRGGYRPVMGGPVLPVYTPRVPHCGPAPEGFFQDPTRPWEPPGCLAAFGAVGKGPYPFASRAASYVRYSDARLQHARRDARAARDNADRTAKAYSEQYGWASGAATEWRNNYGWYADDVHTILAEIRRRMKARR